jgi:hypothetical protein
MLQHELSSDRARCQFWTSFAVRLHALRITHPCYNKDWLNAGRRVWFWNQKTTAVHWVSCITLYLVTPKQKRYKSSGATNWEAHMRILALNGLQPDLEVLKKINAKQMVLSAGTLLLWLAHIECCLDGRQYRDEVVLRG